MEWPFKIYLVCTGQDVSMTSLWGERPEHLGKTHLLGLVATHHFYADTGSNSGCISERLMHKPLRRLDKLYNSLSACDRYLIKVNSWIQCTAVYSVFVSVSAWPDNLPLLNKYLLIYTCNC